MILLFLLILNCFALEQKIYPEENRKNIKPLSIGRKIDWDYGLYRSLYQSNDGNIVLKKWDRGITCPNNLVYRFLCRWLTKSNGSIGAKTSMYVFESLQPSRIKHKFYNALFSKSKYSHEFDSFLLIQNQNDKISITKIIRKPECGHYYPNSFLFYPLMDECGTIQFLAENPEPSGKQPAFPLYEWRVYSTNSSICLCKNDYYISGKITDLFTNSLHAPKLYFTDYAEHYGRALFIYFKIREKPHLQIFPLFEDRDYCKTALLYKNLINVCTSKSAPIIQAKFYTTEQKMGGGLKVNEDIADLSKVN